MPKRHHPIKFNQLEHGQQIENKKDKKKYLVLKSTLKSNYFVLIPAYSEAEENQEKENEPTFIFSDKTIQWNSTMNTISLQGVKIGTVTPRYFNFNYPEYQSEDSFDNTATFFLYHENKKWFEKNKEVLEEKINDLESQFSFQDRVSQLSRQSSNESLDSGIEEYAFSKNTLTFEENMQKKSDYDNLKNNNFVGNFLTTKDNISFVIIDQNIVTNEDKTIIVFQCLKKEDEKTIQSFISLFASYLKEAKYRDSEFKEKITNFLPRKDMIVEFTVELNPEKIIKENNFTGKVTTNYLETSSQFATENKEDINLTLDDIDKLKEKELDFLITETQDVLKQTPEEIKNLKSKKVQKISETHISKFSNEQILALETHKNEFNPQQFKAFNMRKMQKWNFNLKNHLFNVKSNLMIVYDQIAIDIMGIPNVVLFFVPIFKQDNKITYDYKNTIKLVIEEKKITDFVQNVDTSKNKKIWTKKYSNNPVLDQKANKNLQQNWKIEDQEIELVKNTMYTTIPEEIMKDLSIIKPEHLSNPNNPNIFLNRVSFSKSILEKECYSQRIYKLSENEYGIIFDPTHYNSKEINSVSVQKITNPILYSFVINKSDNWKIVDGTQKFTSFNKESKVEIMSLDEEEIQLKAKIYSQVINTSSFVKQLEEKNVELIKNKKNIEEKIDSFSQNLKDFISNNEFIITDITDFNSIKSLFENFFEITVLKNIRDILKTYHLDSKNFSRYKYQINYHSQPLSCSIELKYEDIFPNVKIKLELVVEELKWKFSNSIKRMMLSNKLKVEELEKDNNTLVNNIKNNNEFINEYQTDILNKINKLVDFYKTNNDKLYSFKAIKTYNDIIVKTNTLLKGIEELKENELENIKKRYDEWKSKITLFKEKYYTSNNPKLLVFENFNFEFNEIITTKPSISNNLHETNDLIKTFKNNNKDKNIIEDIKLINLKESSFLRRKWNNIKIWFLSKFYSSFTKEKDELTKNIKSLKIFNQKIKPIPTVNTKNNNLQQKCESADLTNQSKSTNNSLLSFN